MLTMDGCRARQERLRALLASQNLDAAVVTDSRDVYYLTGFLTSPVFGFPTVLYIETEGRTVLGCYTTDGEALADERAVYEPALFATMSPDLMRRLARALAEALDGAKQARRIGWQADSLPRLLGDTIAAAVDPDEWVAIDDELTDLQTRKDPDEVALIRAAIGCSLAAYDAVRAAIVPGATEMAVHEAGHRAANLQAGEPVFHSGDYRSGQLGGFARDRVIATGELYIVDAWTTYRGYWSDLCRTFAVGDPSPLQLEVYDHMADVLTGVQEQLKPGLRGTELWAWIDRRIREHPHLRESGLGHHAGHASGVRGHEPPDLNRDREGILQAGNVVSVEPGSYTPELKAGIRLENTFLITEDGCELLSNYPLVLT